MTSTAVPPLAGHPAGPADDRPVLAIDVGGTKLAAALVDAQGRTGAYDVVPTPVSPDADVVFAAVATLLDRVLPAAGARGPSGIGISSAGPVDSDRALVSPVNIRAWRDFPLGERIAERVAAGGERVPVVLAGDGICMAIGEHWLGAGRGTDAMLGVVSSTGVGGGLVLDGHVHAGTTANAGHIGHIPVDLDGEECPCGGRGCVETLASGPSLVRWARRSGWAAPEGATAKDLAADARAGDAVARAAFARGGRALGAAFVAAGGLCDLDRVVVGGGVAQAADLLFPAIEAGLAEFAGLGFMRRMEVVPAELGGSAGLVGAAALVHRPDRYSLRRGAGTPVPSRAG